MICWLSAAHDYLGTMGKAGSDYMFQPSVWVTLGDFFLGAKRPLVFAMTVLAAVTLVTAKDAR